MAKKFPDAVSSQRIAAIASLYQDGMQAGESVKHLALTALSPNPHQPRKVFSEAVLEDLTASIKEHGVLQPLLARPEPEQRYTLIAGHRRLEAARRAGLQTVPVVLREGVSDLDLKVLALVENVQREELHAVDRLRAFKELADSCGTYEQASAAVGMKTDAFKKWMRVKNLEDDLLDLCTHIPDLSQRMLLRVQALPANRRKAEVMRLIRVSQEVPNEVGPADSPPRLPAAVQSSNRKRFELRDDARRLSFVVEIHTRAKRKELTLVDYRDFLRRALDEVETRLAQEPPVPPVTG
ncbi:MAG: ParB/RepB/Spo0J family partition protein [Blastocatellia bacterium]|nr:ParB/RepB/Spo0J family partition protein [Blastocatellia bacterium]